MLARSLGLKPQGDLPNRFLRWRMPPKVIQPRPVGLHRTVAYNRDCLGCSMLKWIGDACMRTGPLSSIEVDEEMPDIIGGASTHHEVRQILVIPNWVPREPRPPLGLPLRFLVPSVNVIRSASSSCVVSTGSFVGFHGTIGFQPSCGSSKRHSMVVGASAGTSEPTMVAMSRVLLKV